MYFKLLMMFLSIIAGTMSGFTLYKRGNEREKYFENMINFLNMLVVDIRFAQNKISPLVEAFMKDNKSRLDTNLSEYLSSIREKGKALALSKGVLKSSEYVYVKSFFAALGTTDSVTQLYELENYKAKFTLYYEDAQKKNKKFSNNYIKLGFLFGLALGIIIL